MLSSKLLKNCLSINCGIRSTQAIRVSYPCQVLRCFSDEQTHKNRQQHTKKSFASLLRNSTFIQMGEHKNVNVTGKIFQVQDNNIYVDFGGKFHCVCDLDTYSQNPEVREKFQRGTKVIVKLQDFELSARFLGATKDTTLLEADGRLLGLYKYDNRREKSLNEKRRAKSLEPDSKSENIQLDAKTEVTVSNEIEELEYDIEASPEAIDPVIQNSQDLSNVDK